MPRLRHVIIAGASAAGVLMAALPATAASASSAAHGRFQLMPVEGGALRLDTATGAMDLCQDAGEGWRCRRIVSPPLDAAPAHPAPGAAAPEAAELARLRAALAEIAAIAAAAVPGDRPRPVMRSAEARREIDEAIEVTDYTLRRVLDLYRTFQQSTGGDRED